MRVGYSRNGVGILMGLVILAHGGKAKGEPERSTPPPDAATAEATDEAPPLAEFPLTPENPATPALMPPELRRIQKSLGGSAVEKFPLLQSMDELRRPSISQPLPAQSRRPAIESMRDAAWHMDSWANRLEELELYNQADALRAHAQRLRLDARAIARHAPFDGNASEAPSWSTDPDPIEPPPAPRRFGAGPQQPSR